ncbi:MAG: threonine--tRNA ligase [Rothia sp. (in: high G+C Gram-positive bacteria)]|uniref:threonine--tRNA ligase n=1 Tax=Rothia sp. (in: high G+C Gram-positive bacteria) TaxID=1885016 RepID=UPI0027003964|nr:threonine--tRNA ligase [Rothia sp. (in: high G+C Gram-positive bacteria)]
MRRHILSVLSIFVAGEPRSVEAGSTAADLFADNQDIVVARINGKLVDLSTELTQGVTVEPVSIHEQEGLEVLRHSVAHIMAQAVQDHRKDAKLGIGPYITDGFYFDFDVEEPFTPEDLKKIEKSMVKIIKSGQTFHRRVVTQAEAEAEMANEPYKLELLKLSQGPGSGADAAEGASIEVGDGEITIYDNVNKKGETVWKDLCRGPHVPSTKVIANGYALMRSGGAYWRGSEKNPMLQRIYGTAWPTKEELVAYKDRIAEAERRDHRRLGEELDLFSFPKTIGPGLPVFHPKGGIILREMENYVRTRHIEEGFQYVKTPHISKEDLFYTSGHLPYYADGMFPPMEDEGQAYRLKAMNCPMHNEIFRSRGRSYRELPLRFFEFGTVYRDEKSGVLQGLTRVRMITQDDSHSYVTKEQAPDEVKHLLNFMLSLLKDFGLNDFYLELSTRDTEGDKKDKFIGTDEQWEEATAVLEQVAAETGLELVADPGGAAFYGPKISVQAKDAIGRTWQMSTVQYDFNQPTRFGLEFQASDGSRQEPVMIHSAKFGSLERFFGVLTEHYAGAFPAWLAPVQVIGVPVAEAFNDYMGEVAAKLAARGVRVEVDYGTDRFPKKIRTASKEKVPFILIAGGEDAENGAVSFRFRDGSQENGVPVDEAVERIAKHIEERVNEDPQ